MESKKLKLRDKHIELLSRLPEQGMGYQIVDLVLRDGNLLKNRIVLNATHLKLQEEDSIDRLSIVEIRLAQTNSYL